jgi:ketosteroid isomerase-like protein
VLLRRLRIGSWLRRAALTRAVRVGFAANNRRDYDAMQVLFHPEVEIRPPTRPGSDAGVGAAGLQPVYRGRAGLREFLEDWKSGFGDFRYEPREIADAGDGRFAVRLDFVGTIAGTDTELREEAWTVYIVSDGLVVHNPTFYSWPEALAALTGSAEIPAAAQALLS